MAHPKPSDWRQDDAVLRAGTRGFNVLTELPRVLKKEYRWLNDFEVGFFVENDIPQMRAMGWTFLRREHFDTENFNQAIGLGHGVTDDGSGNIKWRDNFLMIMPNDFRKRVIDIRNEETEKAIARDTSGAVYVPPGSSPEHVEQAKATYEESTIVNSPSPKGRPRKET